MIPRLVAAVAVSVGLTAPSAAHVLPEEPARTAAVPAPERAAAARLVVDLSERQLYVYDGESLMNTYSVAVGTAKYPTPTGRFTIDRIIWNPGWVPPPDAEWAEDEEPKAPGDPDNPMQSAKLFFEYPDYYIHGTNASGTLGTAASHGCIRMNRVDVEHLAEFVQKAGGEARSDGWFERVRAAASEETVVRLSTPVPIEIRE